MTDQEQSPEGKLLQALTGKKPIALLLGQSAWTSKTSGDSVLKLALAHLDQPEKSSGSWPDLLKEGSLPANFYEWLGERFSRRPIPEWLEAVSKLPWSAILTSSLDSSLRDAFSTTQREPQVILTAGERPVANRSTGRTPIYYLFGRAGVADPAAMPPRNVRELRIRRNLHAIPMLNRLPEVATAVGLTIIDGYDPEKDWLPIDALVAALQQQPPGSVLWFGWRPSYVEAAEGIKDLLDGRIITANRSRLGSALVDLDSGGNLRDLIAIQSDSPAVISLSGTAAFAPKPQARIRVEAVASVVDDSWTAFQNPLGREARYAAFREFHGDLRGPRGLVTGVGNGFAITRDFEDDLWRLVDSAVDGHAKFKEPIVLHGQSGTGKSVALAALVRRLREKKRSLVLYASTRVPLATELDTFCGEAESSVSSIIVIVCDCNAPISRYRDLLLGLRSRGKRIVVVGTTYRQQEPTGTFVEAPEQLSNSERTQLTALLGQFTDFDHSHIGNDRNVLATLYRVLPASRSRLTAGLSREAQATENTVREREQIRTEFLPQSQLASQLIAAGLASSDEHVLETLLDDKLDFADDTARRLIDLVMVPGRLGCHVPINLLLRAITDQDGQDLSKIANLFEDLDLFRWREIGSDGEELLVSPRLTLEAELICRRRILSSRAEGTFIIQLVRAARLSWDVGGTERRFLLELIQQLSNDGPLGDRYKESYLEIARALTELRDQYGTLDPSLMLQESALRRAAIKEDQVLPEEKDAVLEEARVAVQAALDVLSSTSARGAKRLKASLSVELASIYGFLARDSAQRGSTEGDVWSAYHAARAAARAAVGLTATYYPLDVSLWVPDDLLSLASLSKEHRLELAADIYSVLDRINETTLPPDQLERFNTRKFWIGEHLKNTMLTNEAFEALDREGSSVGYYLRARSLGPKSEPMMNDVVSKENVELAREAANYLHSHWGRVYSDERCVRYLLQCEWIVAVKRRLFHGQRAPLPSNQPERRKLFELAHAVNELLTPTVENNMRYLDAVLAWLNDDEAYALEIWHELEREADFVDPGRVVRRHLVTDVNGTAIAFGGRIEGASGAGRFDVRVEGINRVVRLLERDFSDFEMAYGRTISPFAIAFNYIGPIADPFRKAPRT